PVEKVFGNQQIFNHKAFSKSNFNYSLLNEADLVVINGLDVIDQSLQAALHDYLNKDGVLFIIPGDGMDAAGLRTFLQLPAIERVGTRSMQELDKPDYANPFFENVFEERSNAMIMPKAMPGVGWAADRSASLHRKNAAPFLNRSTQNGTVYLLASALEAGYTDFYNHALFVPVMYRMAASI